MVRLCPQNGLPITLTHCLHLGSNVEKKAGSTASDMEKDSGKRAKGQRMRIMDRGSVIIVSVSISVSSKG